MIFFSMPYGRVRQQIDVISKELNSLLGIGGRHLGSVNQLQPGKPGETLCALDLQPPSFHFRVYFYIEIDKLVVFHVSDARGGAGSSAE